MFVIRSTVLAWSSAITIVTALVKTKALVVVLFSLLSPSAPSGGWFMLLGLTSQPRWISFCQDTLCSGVLLMLLVNWQIFCGFTALIRFSSECSLEQFQLFSASWCCSTRLCPLSSNLTPGNFVGCEVLWKYSEFLGKMGRQWGSCWGSPPLLKSPRSARMDSSESPCESELDK